MASYSLGATDLSLHLISTWGRRRQGWQGRLHLPSPVRQCGPGEVAGRGGAQLWVYVRLFRCHAELFVPLCVNFYRKYQIPKSFCVGRTLILTLTFPNRPELDVLCDSHGERWVPEVLSSVDPKAGTFPSWPQLTKVKMLTTDTPLIRTPLIFRGPAPLLKLEIRFKKSSQQLPLICLPIFSFLLHVCIPQFPGFRESLFWPRSWE